MRVFLAFAYLFRKQSLPVALAASSTNSWVCLSTGMFSTSRRSRSVLTQRVPHSRAVLTSPACTTQYVPCIMHRVPY